ncbi:hypothetical protein D6777_04195 [Candidatus Woesearchaeota archaeon]|nr:MAG: hypothetical protein D6777_04195 [Candidatus Woesearchaeota archaeon]
MNKRGQIYILVALVLSIVVFGLVSVNNKAQQKSLQSNFEKLSANYAQESARFVNSLIGTEEDLTKRFTEFTRLFTAYSKTQSPDFGLIYVFNYNGKLYVGNYLDENIKIGSGCVDAEAKCEMLGCYSKINANVGFDGLDVEFQVPNEELEDCNQELTDANFPAGVPLEVQITIGDVPYTFKLKKDQPEIVMVSWENLDEQRKVYTSGELVE